MKTAIVLGGRSGTSLVAGMLHILGVGMGERLRAPDAAGPYGYYENLDFVSLIGSLVKNTSEDDIFTPENIKEVTLGDLMNVRDAIWRNEKESTWGWKSPGTSYFIPLFELFVRDPHYIVCKRDFVEVGKSLEKRKDKLPKSAKSWEAVGKRLQDSIMGNTEGKNRLVIDFHDLVDKPTETVDSIIKFLDLEVTDKVKKGAVDLVRPDYRHERQNGKKEKEK